MSRPAIRFDGVWKRYPTAHALQGLSCSVPEGSITALLGRNGAGKTTALKCLMGLLRADAGRMTLLGQDAADLDEATRARVGYVSERTGLDPRLTIAQMIAYTRAFYPTWDDALAAELVQRLALRPEQRIGGLSLGEGRKVALLLNLAFRPEVLVLDEPAANLDVVVRREFLEAVLALFRSVGMTVLLSTHLLADVERFADRVILIEEGRLRVESGLDDLKDRVKLIRVQAANGHAVDPPELPGEIRRRRVGGELHVVVDHYEPGMEERLAAGCHAHAARVDLPLEDIFIALEADAERRTVP